MESFLVEYQNKIIGVYSDFTQAELFVKSCILNNLMTDSVYILTFMTNSCVCVQRQLMSRPNNIHVQTNPLNFYEPIKADNLDYESASDIESSEDEIDREAENKLIMEKAKERIELQHKINMLKVQKEKIEESKRVYESDLKLYNMFKQSLVNTPTFVVPELFSKKFIIMKQLDDQDQLSWDNFCQHYQHETFYSDLLIASNSYENSFITKPDDKQKINIEEEIELNSETSSIHDLPEV